MFSKRRGRREKEGWREGRDGGERDGREVAKEKAAPKAQSQNWLQVTSSVHQSESETWGCCLGAPAHHSRLGTWESLQISELKIYPPRFP